MITWDINTICTGLLLVAMVIIITLERLFPYTKGLPFFRKGFFIDMIWYTFIQSFFLKIFIFDYIIAPAERSLGIAEEGYLSHWPIWALVLLFLVTHDFYIYWFHRFQHSNKWLWRTHEAHHSVEQVDWLAGSRSHVMEIIINQTVEFAPIILLLDTETAAIVIPIKALLDAVWGQFIHSNMDVKLGKLGYVINGPEMHQLHHADDVEIFHGNYATKFSIFDWIFGTAYLPGRKPKKFGIWYEYPRDYFMQHLFSVWRFNVRKAESIPAIRFYLNIRINLVNFFLKLWKKITGRKSQPDLKSGNIYDPKLDLTEIPG